MKIQESVETCITKKYVDFSSTATRSEFWWFILFLIVVQALLGIVSHAVAALFALATLLPYFAVGTRRLRDTDRSPWWWLIGLVPLVGVIVLIVFWAQPGKTPATPT
jgi:uncharacterized membrane protein YhaH (DUF805 family)